MHLLPPEKEADIWTPNPDPKQNMVMPGIELKAEYYGCTKEDVITLWGNMTFRLSVERRRVGFLLVDVEGTGIPA